MINNSLIRMMDVFKKRFAIKVAYLMIGVGLVTMSACEQELEVVFVVDEPIQEYFDRFVHEASLRNLDVAYATSQVDAQIGDITEPNVIGQCAWSQGHNHSITLDQNYWRNANDMQREFLVFHELGHCVLGRDHVDSEVANGNCMSVMSSGTGDCRVLYTQQNRINLLDELFTNGF